MWRKLCAMEPTCQPRLLLLDCDGVLIRSEEANVAYYNQIFRYFDRPEITEADREKRHLLHTLSTPQVIRHFFPDSDWERVGKYADGLEYLDFSGLLQPEPGWAEVLGRVRDRVKVAVATNRGRSARPVLQAVGLEHYMDEVLTVNQVARPKPAPDLLELALQTFGTPPGQAVYVGDSELDREAAAAAGIPFVGFRTEGHIRIEDPYALEAPLRMGFCTD